MLRNDLLCPPITIASTRETNIFWNAPFLGPDFDADQLLVWTHLTQQYLETPSWAHIQRYQATSNDCQAWLALSLFYGGKAENTRKMVVALAALEQLHWSNEETFKFNDYAT